MKREDAILTVTTLILFSEQEVSTKYMEAIKFLVQDSNKIAKIEQISKARSFTDDVGNACYYDDSKRVEHIREVIESE